ncbi:uncharacterized protein HMPREF1541_00260 [Cyphellophora europaea CBS 101466]|uniref:Thioredoxin domain-containing protein n=1 Tax=Cyphellophora europaea (strain CBS 101466) TaxID=1220924 RepID=W2SBG3_CYPE1|nr:uncharacterized protein HMPREF1541_00260 [Cyphellophora europaea CBS 101466]ETN46076.1 hypothetical protein HMPREF1541_00260 [Cyphellophora europaea CBS 101466]
MATADVSSYSDYLPLRISLLEKEKELTRLRDQITKQRNQLPLVAVDKSYEFVDSESGETLSLRNLFGDRKQLIVYHAMFSPDQEQACSSCTLFLDHIPPLEHLRSHNTNLVVVSRAKPEQIKAYKEKMGFDRFRWVSSYGQDFNYDYQVTVDKEKNPHYNFQPAEHWQQRKMPWFAEGEQPGHSIFVLGGEPKDGGVGKGGEAGKVYYAYSTYARGGEDAMTTLRWLDWTPLGRQDGQLEGAEGVGYKRRGEYSVEEVGAKH